MALTGLPIYPQGPKVRFFVRHPQHPMFPRGLGRKSRQEHKPERFFYPDLNISQGVLQHL